MKMAAPQPTSTVQGITLLLLEPDVIVRLSIANYLRDCGYTVIEGAIAADALAVLKAGKKLDVILSEVQLGGTLDGFALARFVRAQYPGIDVVLASGTPGAAARAGALCEEGPLDKPYHPEEIVRRIKLLTERRRTRQDVPPECTTAPESGAILCAGSKDGSETGFRF
jgi:CheY-like chemotaxis protein